VVLVDQSGTPAIAKRKVVEAHRAGNGPKFTAVEVSDLRLSSRGCGRGRWALADRRRLDTPVTGYATLSE
jgi:hypothetical protein